MGQHKGLMMDYEDSLGEYPGLNETDVKDLQLQELSSALSSLHDDLEEILFREKYHQEKISREKIEDLLSQTERLIKLAE